ncbi:uncharacterized protein LOC144110914 [Amblyomma americanum]
MPANTKLVFLVALATCRPSEATGWDARLRSSVSLSTSRLPPVSTESPKAGGKTVPSCPPPPRTDKWSFMGDASLLTQLAFWFGATGILLTLCFILGYFCCCSCGHANNRRRQEDDSLSMLRAPLLPPQPSRDQDQRERRSSVRPLVLSTQTRSGRGLSSTSITYATVYPRTLPTGPSQDRPGTGNGAGSRSDAARGTQSPGMFQVLPPTLESHNSGVQDYGYQDQMLHSYYSGLPTYSSIARNVPIVNRETQAATARTPRRRAHQGPRHHLTSTTTDRIVVRPPP